MKIIYHNRRRLSPELEHGASYVSFADLMARSDIISLNLSLNASTRHIISSAEFACMKDGVVIINTARGALIDEKALVSALNSGKVQIREDSPFSCFPFFKIFLFLIFFFGGTKTNGLVSLPFVVQVLSAGLDVYENEPAVEPGLLDNPKVMLLPHIGTATYETQREMELLVLENLRSCLQSGFLVTPVPEQKASNGSTGNGSGSGSGSNGH